MKKSGNKIGMAWGSFSLLIVTVTLILGMISGGMSRNDALSLLFLFAVNILIMVYYAKRGGFIGRKENDNSHDDEYDSENEE